MKEQLKMLAEIQKIDTTIVDLAKKEDLFQSAVKKKEEEIINEDKLFNEEKAKLELLEKEHREHERALKTFEEQKTKIEDKLFSIKTNKEYQASLHEIENIKKQISKKEDEILESMDGIETARKELKEAEENLNTTKEKFVSEKARMEQEHVQYMENVENQKKERDKLVALVDSKLYADYKTIIKVKNGVAIALVENEMCMGCFMKIPPQIYNEVVLGQGLRICPHCQRILYGGDISSAGGSS